MVVNPSSRSIKRRWFVESCHTQNSSRISLVFQPDPRPWPCNISIVSDRAKYGM